MTTFAAFVDATDLKQWAERRTAQETLPELVRRLVHATAPSASRISFRAGEGVQLGGWDGLVTAHAATAFVPAGESGWELGVEKPVLGKARSDLEARCDGGGMLTPETSTFIFVTPRRFRDKDTWAADATRDTPWRLVKAYDADDLATWLEQSPAVHAWISAELGKLPRGIRSLDDVWAAWAQGTLPPFPPGLAIAGRDAEAEEVAAWLTGQPAAHAIRADTVDEALGFLASVVQRLPGDRRTDVLTKTVVVDDVDAWRQLRRFTTPLVLVPIFTPDDAGGTAPHTVILPVDRSSPSRTALSLPRIRREPAEQLLKAMGFDDDNARDLATLARRSLPALRRRLASSPVSTTPRWAAPGSARGLIPVLLTGRWREDHDGDRAVLEQLAGKAYREFAAEMEPWFEAGEPPVRRNGSVVLATAPDEMWDLLARATDVGSRRSRARTRGRPRDIGDQRIGHILRYTPKGDDGRWPPEPVRDLLEELGAEHVEIGLATEVRNSRGVTSRHPTEGGKQERELEAGFRADAAAFAARWPRTAALMTRLADAYARDARREDADAALTEDTW